MFYKISDTQVIIMDFKYLYHSGKSTKNLTFSTKNNFVVHNFSVWKNFSGKGVFYR